MMKKTGGITIRDIKINNYITCNRKQYSKKEDSNGNLIENPNYGQCQISVDNLIMKFKTNAFENYDYNINTMKLPQAWSKEGFIGITTKYKFGKGEIIQSLGTPYFAEHKTFTKIAKILQKKGLHVDID